MLPFGWHEPQAKVLLVDPRALWNAIRPRRIWAGVGSCPTTIAGPTVTGLWGLARSTTDTLLSAVLST